MNARLLDRLETIRTGAQGLDRFSPPTLQMECGKTGQIRPHDLDRNEEYHLTTKVTVTFWANTAQVHQARQLAERVLVSRLYGDVLGEMPELMLAISNGDRLAALGVAGRIKKVLEGT